MADRPELRHLVAVPTGRPGRPGRPASDIEGRDLAGSPRTVRVGRPGARTGRTLLLFLGSRCDGCLPFWAVPDTPEACGLAAGDIAVVVTRDGDEEDVGALRELAVGGLVMSGEAWRTYRVHGPPFFVLVDGGEVATEGVAWSPEQVAADVARAGRRDAR